ncbi:hypothetical protein UPYG_G00188090 [Umbra pygmaea]|uniref:Kinesin motor domain-containing protein n=1 Tax=Umbra pygmaea TaxID=75934 RepID=A0ABD0WS77_UMBPY
MHSGKKPKRTTWHLTQRANLIIYTVSSEDIDFIHWYHVHMTGVEVPGEAMTSCLYECLHEFGLERHYSRFTSMGLRKAGHLSALTMGDYSGLGVHRMGERARLFHLVQLVKSMEEEEENHKNNDTRVRKTTMNFTSPSKGPICRQFNFDHRVGGRFSEPKCGWLNGYDSVRGIGTHPISSPYTRVKTQPKYDIGKGSPTQRAQCTYPCKQTVRRTTMHWDNSKSIYNQSVHVKKEDTAIRKNSRDRTEQGREKNGTPRKTYKPRMAGEQQISVCVRKRPLTRAEGKRGEADVVSAQDGDAVLVQEVKQAVDLTQYMMQHRFYYDQVFGEESSNEDVYLRTAYPLVQHVLTGGKATCFAYGQSGAGKTHTMLGSPPETPGLYALAARDIFTQLYTLQNHSHPPAPSHVYISFFEIYCGRLYDLLDHRKRLFPREDGQQVVQIAGLKEVKVESVSSLMQVVWVGMLERTQGASGLNSASSRSHALLQIQLRNSGHQATGRMYFVDLAGSERAADSGDPDRLRRMEGAEINQSLLALKECIRSLDQEQSHTPFRQSKLTQVLKESFVGDSKTCMIANISPSHLATEHTLNTLRYADRVKELRGRRGSELTLFQSPKHNGWVKSPSGVIATQARRLAPGDALLCSTPKGSGALEGFGKGREDLCLDHTTPVRGSLGMELQRGRRTEGLEMKTRRMDRDGDPEIRTGRMDRQREGDPEIRTGTMDRQREGDPEIRNSRIDRQREGDPEIRNSRMDRQREGDPEIRNSRMDRQREGDPERHRKGCEMSDNSNIEQDLRAAMNSQRMGGRDIPLYETPAVRVRGWERDPETPEERDSDKERERHLRRYHRQLQQPLSGYRTPAGYLFSSHACQSHQDDDDDDDDDDDGGKAGSGGSVLKCFIPGTGSGLPPSSCVGDRGTSVGGAKRGSGDAWRSPNEEQRRGAWPECRAVKSADGGRGTGGVLGWGEAEWSTEEEGEAEVDRFTLGSADSTSDNDSLYQHHHGSHHASAERPLSPPPYEMNDLSLEVKHINRSSDDMCLHFPNVTARPCLQGVRLNSREGTALKEGAKLLRMRDPANGPQSTGQASRGATWLSPDYSSSPQCESFGNSSISTMDLLSLSLLQVDRLAATDSFLCKRSPHCPFSLLLKEGSKRPGLVEVGQSPKLTPATEGKSGEDKREGFGHSSLVKQHQGVAEGVAVGVAKGVAKVKTVTPEGHLEDRRSIMDSAVCRMASVQDQGGILKSPAQLQSGVQRTSPHLHSPDEHIVSNSRSSNRSQKLIQPSPHTVLQPIEPLASLSPSVQEAQEQAKCRVVQAHCEQLEKMESLCRRQQTLLCQQPDMDFKKYVQELDEMMEHNTLCAQSLRAQIQFYLSLLPTHNAALQQHAGPGGNNQGTNL